MDRKSDTLSIRIPREMRERLEALKRAQGRAMYDVVCVALDRELARQERRAAKEGGSR